MELTLRVWRQRDRNDTGKLVTYKVNDVNPDMSFLEMLDVLNQQLLARDEEPIAFAHDCREGICGTCGIVINGRAHGPGKGTAVCQLHMRSFKGGETLTLEPWRARAFPVLKDLLVDRRALDRIMEAGGYITVNAGSAPEANSIPVPKANADRAFDAAQCIQCGACVAACPNASAMLFTAAKVGHLGLLPQGQPEREMRVVRMVSQHDREGFGHCTFYGECEAVCPKEISISFIARLNRDYATASRKVDATPAGKDGEAA